MNKNVLYLMLGLGGAGVAYMLYRFMQTPSQVYSTTSLNPYSDPSMTLDQSMTYPFRANVPPRVDNSNQPWANNNRAALAQIGGGQIDVNLSNTAMIADFAKNASTISSSLTSMWDDFGVSDWFSDSNVDSIVADVDFDNALDWSGSGDDSQWGAYA